MDYLIHPQIPEILWISKISAGRHFFPPHLAIRSEFPYFAAQ